MAYNKTITCMQCGHEKNIICGSGSSPSLICHDCLSENAAKEKKTHLDELKALTVEERLAKIEELLYEAPWRTMIRMQNARF